MEEITTDDSIDHVLSNFFEILCHYDIELAESLSIHLSHLSSFSIQNVQCITQDILWGIKQELQFGKAIAKGYMSIIAFPDILPKYHHIIHLYGQSGPTLGKIIAASIAPILHFDTIPGLMDLCHQTIAIMLQKGVYTLHFPLSALASIFQSGDSQSGISIFKLLSTIYSQPLSYNYSLYLSKHLPDLWRSLVSSKRSFQIDALRRIAEQHIEWSESFEQGLTRGLSHLNQHGLSHFVSNGLTQFKHRIERGHQYFSLSSYEGRSACYAYQHAIELNHILPQLNRYLKARISSRCGIRSLSAISSDLNDQTIHMTSDHHTIYLPQTMGYFDNQKDNIHLYKLLVKMEAGQIEWGTYDFDLEKLSHSYSHLMIINRHHGQGSDIEQFIDGFSKPDLALDLFQIIEQGRIRWLMSHCYPGVIRSYRNIFDQYLSQIRSTQITRHPLFPLYTLIAIDRPHSILLTEQDQLVFRQLHEYFQCMCKINPRVEDSAAWVVTHYERIVNDVCKNANSNYQRMAFPFGRKIVPKLITKTLLDMNQKADQLQQQLLQSNIHIYQSDIRKWINSTNGNMSEKSLQQLLEQKGISLHQSHVSITHVSPEQQQGTRIEAEHDSCPVSWYKEWDCRIGDYLHDHTRVRHRIAEGHPDMFYQNVLLSHSGLLKHIRRSFELIRPEGLQILRKWHEGDDFDYRALIDYAIDRKSKKTPSERLYKKRVKQYRDVSVLLLIDLSRSTANDVPSTAKSVLQVEKEAIVLFCEALTQCGDPFCLAGFSGTGHLGVDFYLIKDFSDPLDDTIKGKISGMVSQRSTRMGAAIRHATTMMHHVLSKIRLIIILGDGFPNDIDYKKEYAITDTRMAIREARSQGVYVHGITVNLSSDAMLDQLYGKGKHHIISDVKELPDKLPLIYRNLTKE